MPFGGVQMIFSEIYSSYLQLWRVSLKNNILVQCMNQHIFFLLKYGKQKQPIVLELRHIYRQEERIFIDLLDKIRTGTMEFDDFQLINERFIPIQNGEEFFITLCSRNDIARHINEERSWTNFVL